jgi:hypothetical protein
MKLWNGFIWFGTGACGGFFEHGDVPSGSIKDGVFLSRRVTANFSRRTLLHGGR